MKMRPSEAKRIAVGFVSPLKTVVSWKFAGRVAAPLIGAPLPKMPLSFGGVAATDGCESSRNTPATAASPARSKTLRPHNSIVRETRDLLPHPHPAYSASPRGGLQEIGGLLDERCEGGNRRAVADLIYDVGMEDGTDTGFYLKKGFRVVAVEADPELASRARERFSDEIAAGRLVVLN